VIVSRCGASIIFTWPRRDLAISQAHSRQLQAKPLSTERIPYKRVVATVFVIGMFMDIMDTTVINTALPTLAREFNAPRTTIEWVSLGYLLSLAVWIPASGWLGDRFGTKRVFLLALGLFTIGSALCGLSRSIGELVAFRILQGVGGGMLTPVGTAMLFRAYPPRERAKASAVLMIPAVLAPALGPIVGGWLVTNASWRWIFTINVPFGILGLLFGGFFLHEYTEGTAGRFDGAGFVLSATGLSTALYALTQAPDHGWTSPAVLLPGALGVSLLAVLVYVETHIDDPMLAFRLLRERMFRNANIVLFLTYSSFAGLLFLLPLFLQTLRGLDAFESGLTTFPQALGVIVSGQFVGRLYPRTGPRRLIIGGMTGMLLATLVLVTIDLDTSLWTIREIMFVRGIFMAFAFVPLQAATYANVSAQDTGRASAIFSTQRQVAAALGVAVLATVWISRTDALTAGVTDPAAAARQAVAGFHAAYIVGAGMIAAAVAAGFLIRDSDAAASMRETEPRQHPEAPEPETPEAR